MQTMRNNEAGFAHLGLVLLVIGVLGIVGLGYWRVSSSSKTVNRSADDSQIEQVQTLPQNLQDLKTLDEVGLIAGASSDVSIIKFVLESKDGTFVYKIVLSNGKKLVIDASTGNVLSEETTDVSDDDKIPSGIQITLSPADAYKLAAAKSSSPIKSIEMEVEDKKVVYKIEFLDGSKVEIDASSGSVLKSEIKDESEEDDDGEDDENEDSQDEVEDNENEDSDDSVDSEDHEEEDR